jgi:hypothetical protein
MLKPIVLVVFAAISFCPLVEGQKDKNPVPAGPLLKRTSSRHEIRSLGYGGTLTLVGAPEGAITIESWQRNEVDITADLELRATTEDDLSKLATVDGFFLDSSPNHLRILTTGTHDRVFMKRTAKDFPKNLLGIPFRIDYKLKVPAYVDIEIDAGQGPFTISGIDGSINFKAGSSDAKVDVAGGAVKIVIATGTVDINIGARSWRGVGADVQVASGNLNVSMPAGFNADIDGTILRTGRIENSYGIAAKEGTLATERQLQGQAGSGGAHLSFTVAEGTITFKKAGD